MEKPSHVLHSPVEVTWKLQCHFMTVLPGQTRFTTGTREEVKLFLHKDLL